jgi:hypothetical protein
MLMYFCGATSVIDSLDERPVFSRRKIAGRDGRLDRTASGKSERSVPQAQRRTRNAAASRTDLAALRKPFDILPIVTR